MKDSCKLALDSALQQGADWVDVRIVDIVSEGLYTRNGQIGSHANSDSMGYGIRVLVDGAWGFASNNIFKRSVIEQTAATAVATARAAASLNREKVQLVPEPAHHDFWQTPYQEDPFAVPLEEKLDLLLQIDEILRSDDRIKVAEGRMSFRREHQYYLSSEGADIEQVLLRSGVGYSATAVGNDEVQIRSWPGAHGGNYRSEGYEFIRLLPLLNNAERIREEAIELLTAPPVPSGRNDLILHPSQLVLQIHESVGHATELDRVLGYEANYAGTSFATTDKLGNFRYGSDIVNLVADATLPGGLATAGYDDDGVKAQRWHIVKDGTLTGYMTNRELADRIGLERSQGSNRAEGWHHLPITRICNLSLMPGSWEWDDLLADSEGAIYMETNKSWSIDQERLNFQFGCELAREVKGGKLGRLLKNPNYQSLTPEFWGSCDAICNYKYWELQGVANCGKGQPGQTAEMTHGSAPARFRNIETGIK
jgi:TldD protein